MILFFSSILFLMCFFSQIMSDKLLTSGCNQNYFCRLQLRMTPIFKPLNYQAKLLSFISIL